MRFGAGIVLLAAGVALLIAPEGAPLGVAAALAMALLPLMRAWRGARDTALRSAVVWGFASITVGVIAQVCAALEPLEVGRPAAGHLQYVSVLAALAGLISVLNARSPGSGAWAILMGLLVLVLLIPWLESFLLLRNAAGLGRLRLVAPWSLFYGLLVVAGVTNYLPTRYGPAALVLAAGFGLEYLALAHTEWNPARRGDAWPLVAWFQALAAALADGRARRRAEARNGLEAVWLWFRDHWGVVWALRIQERFNRAAEAAAWPIRLSWYGVVPVSASAGAEIPEEAATTLLGLLRRFATAERLAAEAEPHDRAA
jgi:hypothetical protein